MRYMGDAAPSFLPTGGMDPSVKAQALAYAPYMNAAQQSDVLEIADATAAGKSQRNTRILLGVLGGVALSLGWGYAKKRLRL
jgi:hypothetical protein